MKATHVIFGILFGFLILSGCSSDNEIIYGANGVTFTGTWKETGILVNGNDPGTRFNQVITFKIDNSFTIISKEGGENGQNVTHTGNWHKDGNTLTMFLDHSGETYTLQIIELTNHSLRWETLSNGDDILVQIFER